MSKLNLIVCHNEDLVIGDTDGQLPWHLPEDLQFFKEMTLNNHVIMGRKTHESLKKYVKQGFLPNRHNYILSRLVNYPVFSLGLESSYRRVFIKDLNIAIYYVEKLAKDDESIWIIGGAEIYKQVIDKVDTIYRTVVDYPVSNPGAHFPEINLEHYQLTLLKEGKSLDENIPYRIEKLERK